MTSATAPGTALAAFIDLKDSEDQDVEKERQRKFLLQIQRHTSYNQKSKFLNPYQGLRQEFETEGATCYIEWALRVPVSIKNLKIHGCQAPAAPVLTQALYPTVVYNEQL